MEVGDFKASGRGSVADMALQPQATEKSRKMSGKLNKTTLGFI